MMSWTNFSTLFLVTSNTLSIMNKSDTCRSTVESEQRLNKSIDALERNYSLKNINIFRIFV